MNHAEIATPESRAQYFFVDKIGKFGPFSRRRYGGVPWADVPSAAKRLSRRNP